MENTFVHGILREGQPHIFSLCVCLTKPPILSLCVCFIKPLTNSFETLTHCTVTLVNITHHCTVVLGHTINELMVKCQTFDMNIINSKKSNL